MWGSTVHISATIDKHSEGDKMETKGWSLEWKEAEEIGVWPHLHSDAMEFVPMLAIVKQFGNVVCHYPQVVIYNAPLQEWRLLGQNKKENVILFAELPPAKDVLDSMNISY